MVEVPPLAKPGAVPLRSPFRYPGGKTWLLPTIRQWLSRFHKRSTKKPGTFIEPFAGGSIVSLTVLAERLADRVILCELDEDVCSVWQTIFKDTDGSEWLSDRILGFRMNRKNVHSLISEVPTDTRELAFRTIVRNRVNRGGILAPGAGMLKSGENGKGLLSRWYPKTLATRISEIAKFREQVEVILGDGLDLMMKYSCDHDSAIFVDPPYTIDGNGKKAGSRLYKYHQVDHEEIFRIAETSKADILLTYDVSSEVTKLIKKHHLRHKKIPMNNSHHNTLNELIISQSVDWLKRQKMQS